MDQENSGLPMLYSVFDLARPIEAQAPRRIVVATVRAYLAQQGFLPVAELSPNKSGVSVLLYDQKAADAVRARFAT